MTNKFWSWLNGWLYHYLYMLEVWKREKTCIKVYRKWKDKTTNRIEQKVQKIIMKWKTPRIKYKKVEDLGQRMLHKSVWSGDRK